MKVLYAVQGTGNGHLSRAMDMIPCLKNRAEVDVLISGIQADLVLPFEVKYRMHGLSFIFGKSGGVNIWETFVRSRVLKLIREINELPVSDYDLVFSKHNKGAYQRENMSIEPIDGDRFVESMASAKGVLCGAGFETPAEALFLGKKLMTLPMKNQYEQHLNAAALREMGVPILKNLKPEHDTQVASWLTNEQVVQVDYPDQTQEIVDMILDSHLWHSF